MRCSWLLGTSLFPATAFAHPDTYISWWFGFKLVSKGPEVIDEAREFDQEHSTQILQMFDANHDGKIEPADSNAITALVPKNLTIRVLKLKISQPWVTAVT